MLTKAQYAPRARSSLHLVLAGAVTIGLLAVLVVLPISGLIIKGLTLGSADDWASIFFTKMGNSLIWIPFQRTMVIAVLSALIATCLGGTLAIIIEASDIKGKNWCRAMIALPFIAPSFALAMAWVALFENNLIGGQSGLLTRIGFEPADTISWGGVPIAVVLGLHYFPLAYFLSATALARISDSMIESAMLVGAKPLSIIRSVLIPGLRPALIASFAVCLVQSMSNFSVPAILGTPVRFFTVSTQLYRLIEHGQSFRSAVLLSVLVLFSIASLVFVYRIWNRHGEPTATQATRRHTAIELGAGRTLFTVSAVGFTSLVATLPIVALLVSSLSHGGDLASTNFTLHYWLGESDPSIAQGQAGVLQRSVVFSGLWTTLLFGLGASLLATLVAWNLSLWARNRHLQGLVPYISSVSLLPAVIPSIGIGASFVAMYGAPIGPIPALYGSVWMLIMVGAASALPYAMQSTHTALAYIPRNLEESALFAGASKTNILQTIFIPLSLRATIAAIVLNFSRLIRNLDLVILVFTPATPLLAVLAYRFSVDGYPQFANALALIILLLALATKIFADFLQSKYTDRTQAIP